MKSFNQVGEEFVNDVWRFFYKLGITDDIEIVEYVAFLFLIKYHKDWNNISRSLGDGILSEIGNSFYDLKDVWGYPYTLVGHGREYEPLIPEPSSRIKVYDLVELKQIFDALFDELDERGFLNDMLGSLFNRIVIPHVTKMSVGGRYPTLRHLTDWAIDLVEISSETMVADLACGSGGFLVAAAQFKPAISGIEISPNWARIASANCLLHGMYPEIYIGNALSVIKRDITNARFNVILMNPPFGAKVDDALVNMAFDSKLSGRSETVLTALAYEHLAENGQMFVFLPSGSLFANSGGEQILRERWIKNGELAAVVTLPKDAFQPYSQVVTHALLIEKTQQPSYINWFFQPRFDGFTSGRNRQPDPEHNDLPLVTAAIRSRKESQAVIPLTTADQGLVGYRVLLPDGVGSFLVARLSRMNSSEIYFSVDFGNDTKMSPCWIDQADIQTFDKEMQPIDLPTPDNYVQEIQATFLQGAYTLQLSNQGGEIRGERKPNYPLQISTQWEDGAWMGIVLNADGYPTGPAFLLNDVPTQFEKADGTVFPLDIEIPLTSNIHKNAYTDENNLTLVLFPPGKLEGMSLADGGCLVMSGKHHWLRIHSGKNNLPQFEIFYHEEDPYIFESDGQQCGVVFTPEGYVLGVAVPSHIIQKTSNLDLQPASYLPQDKGAGAEVLESPAQILANIHQSQASLSSQIMKLLNLAELGGVATEAIPPHITVLHPIGRLEGIQKAIWDVIQTKIELTRQGTTPLPFQLEDLELPYTLPEIQLTLDLFERMGLLVKVSIKDAHYYRLISTRETDKGKKP